MKKLLRILLAFLLLPLYGCASPEGSVQIAATTLPVYAFAHTLCADTGLRVTRLITEEVSCLHDYSLNVRQVKAIEQAQVIVISGAGMEPFMEDLLQGKATIDASVGIALLGGEDEHRHTEDHGEAGEEDHHHSEDHDEPGEEGHRHSEDHDESGEEGHRHSEHSHEQDPHIWLSPLRAIEMVRNICAGLTELYPEHADTFARNEELLIIQLIWLQEYGASQLQELSCRELITFHDGFSYLADAFDLHILEAIEEESGSEASARELIDMITLVQEHDLPAVFVETNGSTSASGILSRETGAKIYALDTIMSGEDYFSAMYRNIDTLKEALQ